MKQNEQQQCLAYKGVYILLLRWDAVVVAFLQLIDHCFAAGRLDLGQIGMGDADVRDIASCIWPGVCSTCCAPQRTWSQQLRRVQTPGMAASCAIVVIVSCR